MKIFRFLLLIMAAGLIHAATSPAYTIYTDEAAFKQALAGSFAEAFEDEAVWGAVRSGGTTINAAAAIANQGITWRSPDRISTSLGAGQEGYGIFAYEHQIPDRLWGESSEILVAIGFWARSNTPPAKLHLILDERTLVDFDDVTLTTTPVFFGVIDPDGFTRFELVEQEGAVGDEKRFSADSFTFSANADVTPPPVPDTPTANAGTNQVVTEGDSLTLSGSGSGGGGSAVTAYAWEQIAGPTAPLSHSAQARTNLVAPPLAGADADLRFRLTVTDADGDQAQDEVLVMVVENGITGYPAEAYTFFGAGGDPLGMTLGPGVDLVQISAADPADLPNDGAQPPPDQIPYDLFDFTLKLASPGGSVSVDFLLPEVADPLAGWFKHGPGGWQSFGSQAVFSSDGQRVTLTLTDGGPLDADGEVNGFITDPSGLAWYSDPQDAPPPDPDTDTDPTPQPGPNPQPGDGSGDGDPPPRSDSGGGGGGGCFISATGP